MHVFTRSSRHALPRRLAVAGAATVGALLLAACGGSDSGTGQDGATGSSASAEASSMTTSKFNDADVMFAQGMIPHHEQAIEMAALANGRASDQEIKELAQQIEEAQEPEIATMRSWLKAWGKPESSGMGQDGMDHSGMDHGSMTGGMMSEEEMAALKAAKGTAFDRGFARLMIEHHKGALVMAEMEQKSGSSTEAKELAAAVIKGQSAEIDQMKAILERL